MKINLKPIILSGILSSCALILLSASYSDESMTRLEDGTYVIDTTKLGEDIKGFKGNTPIKLYIKDDKVLKIEYLDNQETPRFFNRLREGFQETWYGSKVDKAKSITPDGNTGATFSAKAITENVKAALEYYQNHKK